MENILENLKKHFRDTPREKVLEDWALVEKTARRGPAIREFLECSKEHVGWKYGNYFVINEINDILANPKVTFGFVF